MKKQPYDLKNVVIGTVIEVTFVATITLIFFIIIGILMG